MIEQNRMHRRQFLNCSLGFAASAAYPLLCATVAVNDGGPLAPKPGHFPAKAKRLLIIYLTGGVSHVDLFDPKPKLKELNGKVIDVPSSIPLSKEMQKHPILASPWEFEPSGKSGVMISNLLPKFRQRADDLCVIRTMHTDLVEHFQATLAMNTGSATLPMPSIGAWISYGLGTENPNLPSFVVLCEEPPYASAQVWDSGFLPPFHQGTRITPGDDPVPNLKPPARDTTLAEMEAMLIRDANELHAVARPEDLELKARIRSFDTARGMMKVAPRILDVTGESAKTLELYGVQAGDKKSLGYQCLMARRLLESGVRVVELIESGADGDGNWDAHNNITTQITHKTQRIDAPLAALMTDLKQRGMLSDTLVAICTEFGRTPWTNEAYSWGRHHWGKAFSCLLAGGGVKGGCAFGQTNELGSEIVENGVHVHDYHATILHLMGLDHTKLTYRYAGRDFRLTDVSGRVVREILA
ncbi:MAG TPA: DUF1501 domain-containing protein [Bryobacteraceae bacterium]|nr:DUF1501 domain-containing protein [Bryobacteraceae bacterium]